MSCYTGISAGYQHSLALFKDGRVTGWGLNDYGQTTIPVGIGNNATGIAAGGLHSLALLKDGRVTGWGRNDYGQTNIPVGIGNNATGISAGIYHSLALLKDGRVTGWGDNGFGQIDIPVGIGNNATGISAGGYHSLALLKDGRVTGWGAGATNTNTNPNHGQIIIPAGIGNNATGISAGGFYSLALLKDGTLTGWGWNNHGVTTIPVGIGNNATGISAGSYHSLALLKDGRVTGWGWNDFGQINIPVGIGTNVTGISAGWQHSLALLKDGRVTGWGGNAEGQINIPACPKINQTITFPSIPTKTFGDAPFSLTATASSNLAVSYTSSNTSVATVAGNIVTIVGVGTTTITASQAGDSNYNAAIPISQTLAVNKADQTITFPSIPTLTINNILYFLNAIASSNLPVTYSIDFPNIATIDGNILNLIKVGTATITASQAGNINYNPAPNVTRSLIIARAVPVVTNITTSPAYVKSRLSDIQISASTSIPGIIYWSNPSYELMSLGQQTYTAIFVPNDPVNYENVNLNITINVLSNPWKLLLVDELPLKLNGVNANFSTAYSSEYNSNYLLINGRPVYYYKDDYTIYTVNGYSISRKIFDKNGNIF